MADIIHLEDHRRSSASSNEGRIGPALIVLFTGVRYERYGSGNEMAAGERQRVG